MKVEFFVLILILILTLGSKTTATGHSDDVCLSLRQSGPQPEVTQGRPGKQGADGQIGPIGPRGVPGPQGSCTCDLSEVRVLRDQAQILAGNKHAFDMNSKNDKLKYCCNFFRNPFQK